MTNKRGRSHTTLTPTAKKLVQIIKKIDGVKMIAPGEISSSRSKSQRITFTKTNAGLHIIISGNGIQKIAVHTINEKINEKIISTIKKNKIYDNFIFFCRITG